MNQFSETIRGNIFLELFIIFLVIVLFYSPFLFLAWHIIRRNQERRTKFFSLVGAIWGCLSLFPYLIMVGGHVEPPLFITLLSFPAWISLKIPDLFWKSSLLENHLVWDFYSIFQFAVLVLPLFVGMTIAYIFSLVLKKINQLNI